MNQFVQLVLPIDAGLALRARIEAALLLRGRNGRNLGGARSFTATAATLPCACRRATAPAAFGGLRSCGCRRRRGISEEQTREGRVPAAGGIQIDRLGGALD